MKLLAVTAFVFLPTLAVAAPDEADYAKLLRDNGHKHCSKVINVVANWLVDNDAGTIGNWNANDPDSHTAVLYGSKRYSDGSSQMHLVATPTPKGGCDISFSLIIPTEFSCTKLRETTFKDWKFYGEMRGLPMYSDPTSENVNVTFQPVGGACVAMKTGVLFFDKANLK